MVHYHESGGACAVEYDGGNGDDQNWKTSEMEPLGNSSRSDYAEYKKYWKAHGVRV